MDELSREALELLAQAQPQFEAPQAGLERVAERLAQPSAPGYVLDLDSVSPPDERDERDRHRATFWTSAALVAAAAALLAFFVGRGSGQRVDPDSAAMAPNVAERDASAEPTTVPEGGVAADRGDPTAGTLAIRAPDESDEPDELESVGDAAPASAVATDASGVVPLPASKSRGGSGTQPRKAKTRAPRHVDDVPTPDALAEQAALVGSARRALSREAFDEVRRLASLYERSFSSGMFADEVRVLALLADCRDETAGHGSKARAYLDAHAASPFGARIRSACLAN